VVDAVVMARLNLRELARKAEEVAVILEGEGFATLPGELLKASQLLTECREALERATGLRGRKPHPRRG
jgi:hypothetical protein